MSVLKNGDSLPILSLLNQDGQLVSLESFRGSKIVLYFYPKALTPGCTTQSCNLRDAKEIMAEKNTIISGVSADEPKKQKSFDEKHSLGFTLLCDTEHKLAELLGIWQMKKMYGKEYMGIVRSAFIIDEAGIITHSFIKISPADTVPKVLATLN
ncbi:MAG: thioredoxin-dependent thiol peroxidase [Lentisphaeria bacterium]